MKFHCQDWFIRHIGKRIFRVNGSGAECCAHCAYSKEKGLFIGDRSHAMYVYDHQFYSEVGETGFRYAERKWK